MPFCWERCGSSIWYVSDTSSSYAKPMPDFNRPTPDAYIPIPSAWQLHYSGRHVLCSWPLAGSIYHYRSGQFLQSMAWCGIDPLDVEPRHPVRFNVSEAYFWKAFNNHHTLCLYSVTPESRSAVNVPHCALIWSKADLF